MYPYDYKPISRGINHREIFVVMPFVSDFDPIYNDLIKPATTKANDILGFSDDNLALYTYRTKDDLRTTSGWINVLEHLVSAQIVMGVLTSNNPNVFYELGIAHATQPITRQILIANQSYEPTFDTKDLIFYKYVDADFASCTEPLAIKISDAIKTYKIEREKRINHSRMMIGPFDFEVIMNHGRNRNFAVHSKDELWRAKYEEQFGMDSFERHIIGITNLCNLGLLGLNTISKPIDGGVQVEFSYWWTTLGNDLLSLMEIINQEEATVRRSQLPEFFDL